MAKKEARFLNRELSWLEFNQRVLDEACAVETPLLERLKFLAITGSNLDEFFMVRVGGLQILCDAGTNTRDPAGMTPTQQLRAIETRVSRMMVEQYACFQEIEAGLADKGIRRVLPGQMNDRQRDIAEQVFLNEIFPILTPIAVTGREDFPQLVNHTLNICVRLAAVEDSNASGRFAVIPFGRLGRRFLTLHSMSGYSYSLVEDAVADFIGHFFPGETVEECVPFRITLNADIAFRDDTASDLLADMESFLEARKTGDCVRLEISDRAGLAIKEFLQEALQANSETITLPGPIGLTDFMQLTGLPGFEELKIPSWPPQPSPEIDPTVKMFDVIAQKDILLCHPFDSFDPVVRLIEEAAVDPDVLAIKQTLYRTSRTSPVVKALGEAAKQGKYVTVIVELKARFDEARNISWAKWLEQCGVQVIYGVKGLKTHAKICLIVRREPHGIRRYMHFGTGNYNEATARLYSDISLLTCNDELGADATSFLHAVTGYSQPQEFRKIEAAPIGLRERVLEMIEAETKRRQQGQKAHIAVKVNSLADPQVIEALYAASKAGVTIKLNVRGICCLRPGVPGLSENIEVISIVDRFLEHARVFYFYHGGDERVFISSADWMPRNLDRRIELLVPIDGAAARRRLISILDTCFRDNVKARRLLADGSYELPSHGNAAPIRSQEVLFQESREAVRQAALEQRTTFEPHRAPNASD
ncbi:MAG TPA: polyphosphate kinase 1 [Pirellulaceae bacterium]|nr:polyphosphate kinase 1 [Pirellulaceae bacterium]